LYTTGGLWQSFFPYQNDAKLLLTVIYDNFAASGTPLAR
jgi:hypothetical protein